MLARAASLLPALLLFGCAPQIVERKARTVGEIFCYDRTLPLDAVTTSSVSSGIETVKVSFNGQRGRVPGILNLPSNAYNLPIVLLLHGLDSDAATASRTGAFLLAYGYATFALDAPRHGTRRVSGEQLISDDLAETRALLVQATVDYLRGLDYLTSRVDVDTDRVVLMGASFGGILGTLVTAADPRVDAAALIIAGGDFGELAKSSLKELEPLRRAIARSGLHELERLLGDVDPKNWIGSISPRPVHIVNGKQDEVVPNAAAMSLVSAAKEPKTIYWDDVGHTIAITRLGDIVDWLLKNTPKASLEPSVRRSDRT
ncbi:MAG: alpha/beta hydrolase family protein [Fimbriimonadales bacterium]